MKNLRKVKYFLNRSNIIGMHIIEKTCYITTPLLAGIATYEFLNGGTPQSYQGPALLALTGMALIFDSRTERRKSRLSIEKLLAETS